MLARHYRLPSRVKFSQARIFNTPFFSIKITSNTLLYSRFGFIVSKRLDKRAVVRNSIKRKLRSCVEELLPELKPGFDILFIVKNPSLSASRDELLAAVKEAGKVL